MADEPNRTRPRLNTTIAQTTMDNLEGLTVGLNLPHVGITIDYIVAERDRLLAALRAANIDATLMVLEPVA